MDLFLEGVESIALACTLVVLIPTLLLTLASRNPVPIMVGSIMGTATMMWARAGRLWTVDAEGVVVLFLAAAITVSFAVAWALPRACHRSAVATGLLGGALTGWLWRPCVGEYLAETLSRAESREVAGLLQMNLYVAALLIPLLLVVALPIAAPRVRPIVQGTQVRRIGFGIGLLYAIAVAIGQYDDLVGELFRISSS